MHNYKKQNLLLPRVIYGNRGDILSRWGLLNGLERFGNTSIQVFAHEADDLPKHYHNTFIKYGRFHNLLLSTEARRALHQSEKVLWGGGLDITDQSSKSKLTYLLVLFTYYRLLGKKIDCVFQGAGPITTSYGRFISRQVLKHVNLFIARDQYTFDLIKQINSEVNVILAGDAIFLPGFEEQLNKTEPSKELSRFISGNKNLVIGINIRRWFHFSSDLLPYQLAKNKYEKRGQYEMLSLVENYVHLIERFREKYNARILLISAYKPGVFSWEDDLPWLQKIKSYFTNDDEVLLIDEEIPMLDYLHIMQKLDFVISMRLHTSLTAVRFGNPAINLSYSPKGTYIFKNLGMGANVFDIADFLQKPLKVWDRIEYVLDNLESEKKKTQKCANEMISVNEEALKRIYRSL